ncbi:hypothetical protein [Paenibacillus puerhi]|uniref:hypothetical protein n=1 Tax=Paenibacillus puerhi TaxID=2692622 RepID=UPI00135C878E|nr:hypothetical protein [Paenibacillus puerhi]
MATAAVIEPITYQALEDEASLIEQCKQWGLLTEKAVKSKTFLYKKNGAVLSCSVVGLVDSITAVIEFEDQRRHCIHPSYLKEMQASGFVQRLSAEADEQAVPKASDTPDAPDSAAAPAATAQDIPETLDQRPSPAPSEPEQEEKPEEKPKSRAKKEKAPKLQLPEEKVGMTATVKAFVTVPNHFSDNDDEVVIYEAVTITEPVMELGEAWSSHSATLKKLELEIGDKLTFEGKLVAKKLTKHPVPYKINNPAKIKKTSAEAIQE